jgi:arylsulfatase A-like enzyme
MRAALRLRALLASTVLAACGSDAPPATRLRLWVDLAPELVALPAAPPPVTVLASDFAHGLEGWRPIVNPGREPGGLVSERGSEDGRAFVRLRGPHGGLLAVVPVEPDTCYSFTGLVRAVGLVSPQADFDGARFWVAEASGTASFEEFRTTRKDLLMGSWSPAGVRSDTGWRKDERMFVTTPSTRFLHIVLALATAHDVTAGAVDFAELRLERHTRQGWWQAQVAHENTGRARIDPPGPAGFHARRVSAELGVENRPAFVLLPGESLRFALPALAPGRRLELGVGPFAPALWPGRAGSAALRVRLDGSALGSTEVVVPAASEDARWTPLALALPDGARTLELAVEGDAPLALGAPLVRGSAPPATRPNVLLVSIDTLRADRVGAYGNPDGHTPNLDALARVGLLCRDTSAQAPYTLPSHATLLTGQFPSVHGVVAHESTLGVARSTSLAEALARAGYATRAFTAGGFVNSAFGLDQGFDAFSEIDPVPEVSSHYGRKLTRKYDEARAARLLEEQGYAGVERWLAERGGEPFFLFLHTYTVHDYDAPRAYITCDQRGCPRPKIEQLSTREAEPASFTPEMRAHVAHLYEAALRYTDARLGRILEHLRALGLAESTLVVVTSDHGEEFFEHGQLQHGRTLYEELLRIPLILVGPGIPARELTRPAMQIDVAPTILARLGLPPLAHAQGVDLLGPEWKARAVWSEVDSRFAHEYALRTEGGAKTIHDPREKRVQFPSAKAWEQFELSRDPTESQDLAGDEDPGHAAARRSLAELRRTLEALGASLGAAGSGEVDEGTLQDLEGLGYGGGSAAEK